MSIPVAKHIVLIIYRIKVIFNVNPIISTDPAKIEQSTYLRDLEAQMAEQRARRLQEKKELQADWWEKKTDPAYNLPSPKKPHPSMV